MKVIFWKGPSTSIYSRLIRLVSVYPYTHVELLFSHGYRFGIDSHKVSGFYKEEVEINDKKVFWHPAHWDAFDVTNLVKEDVVYSWCLQNKGKKYDWISILFSQAFKFGLNSRNRWFCSEIVVEALRFGGLSFLQTVKPHRISPSKLAEIFIKNNVPIVLP